LDGITVLELSTRVAGAHAGRVLHLLGADVVRWEAPLTADCLPRLQELFEDSINRGKRSMALDALAVLPDVDVVVVDSLHDDAADGRWRARTAEVVARLAPTVPVVDVTAFSDHPRERPGGVAEAPTPATTLTVSGIAGMSWGIGHPGREPLTLPYDLADYLAGTEAAGAAVLALLASYQSGTESEQFWDVAANDVVASYVGQIGAVFLPFGRPWARDGARATQSGGFYPGAMFACRDGHVAVVCRTPREWTALKGAMGDPEWSRDERFADARVVAQRYADEADGYLSAWVAEHTCAEMMQIGRVAGFAVASVLTPAEGSRLEQFEFQGLMEADLDGLPSVPGTPWVLRERPDQSGVAPTAPAGTPDKPLAGLVVLDLSWVWSGPMATSALADLGAEVIKVECRDRPDPARTRGRALRDGVPAAGPDFEVSTYFNQMNRGKRSIAVNIATPEGADLIRRLAGTVDVVVENMRPGALQRRGLNYDRLAEENPALVMLSMSMMGQEGPMKDIGGYAPVMSGLSGMDAVVGYSADDLIGLYNPSLGDPNGAAHAVAVLLAALVRRARSGRGCWIDVPQIGCMLATLRGPLLEELHTGSVRVPANGHSGYWPHGTFRTSGEDEWLTVAARTDAERRALGEVTGTALPDDPTAAESLLRSWAAERDARIAAELLRAAGVPAAKVEDFPGMVTSDWAKTRMIYRQLDHPYLGMRELFTISWKANGRSFGVDRSSPGFGADTDDVLTTRLGLDDDRLRELRECRAIE